MIIWARHRKTAVVGPWSRRRVVPVLAVPHCTVQRAIEEVTSISRSVVVVSAILLPGNFLCSDDTIAFGVKLKSKQLGFAGAFGAVLIFVDKTANCTGGQHVDSNKRFDEFRLVQLVGKQFQKGLGVGFVFLGCCSEFVRLRGVWVFFAFHNLIVNVEHFVEIDYFDFGFVAPAQAAKAEGQENAAGVGMVCHCAVQNNQACFRWYFFKSEIVPQANFVQSVFIKVGQLSVASESFA